MAAGMTRSRPAESRSFHAFDLMVLLGLLAAVLVYGRSHLFWPDPGTPAVAYALVAGEVVKLDPASGRVLVQHRLTTPSPALAVSPDGQAAFVLDSIAANPAPGLSLLKLAGPTLALRWWLPAYDTTREGGPPRLALTADGRTVVLSHSAAATNAVPDTWLSYVDAATGQARFRLTALPGCGGATVIPTQPLAVLCFGAGDIRLVDTDLQQVVATIQPDSAAGATRFSWPVAAGPLRGQAALAVVLDDGQLLRVDLASRRVTQVADLAPDRWRVVPFGGAAFARNGQVVLALSPTIDDWATARATSLLVVDAMTGRVAQRINQESRYGIAVSPDGRRVFLRAQPFGEVLALDLSTHRLLSFGMPKAALPVFAGAA